MFIIQQLERGAPGAPIKKITLKNELEPITMSGIQGSQRALFFESPGSSEASVHMFGMQQNSATIFNFDWSITKSFVFNNVALEGFPGTHKSAMGVAAALYSMVRDVAVCRLLFMGISRKCVLTKTNTQPAKAGRLRVSLSVRFVSDDFAYTSTVGHFRKSTDIVSDRKSRGASAGTSPVIKKATAKKVARNIQSYVDEAIGILSGPIFEAKIALLSLRGSMQDTVGIAFKFNNVLSNAVGLRKDIVGVSDIDRAVLRFRTELEVVLSSMKISLNNINWSKVAHNYYERRKLESIMQGIHNKLIISNIILGRLISDAPTQNTYIVHDGDTLQSIAKFLAVEWQYLYRINKLESTVLYAGQVIHY